MNLAETIHDISLKHCENGGLILGQCLTAVGRVNGTVPDHPNVIELPMTDVAGSGFAVGMALADRRPIFIMRFQDFAILNGSSLINYAAKLKELHNLGCPVFIRAIASEGLGPVHSSVLHSIYCHFPGFKVVAPTSPTAYKMVWKDFMDGDTPYFVSEHRDTYKNTSIKSLSWDNPDITILGISVCINEAIKAGHTLADEEIYADVFPITELKPLTIFNYGSLILIVDPSYPHCSIGRDIAYELMLGGSYVEALTLEDQTKCLVEPYRNEYPKADLIHKKAKQMVKGKEIGIYGMTFP